MALVSGEVLESNRVPAADEIQNRKEGALHGLPALLRSAEQEPDELIGAGDRCRVDRGARGDLRGVLDVDRYVFKIVGTAMKGDGAARAAQLHGERLTRQDLDRRGGVQGARHDDKARLNLVG